MRQSAFGTNWATGAEQQLYERAVALIESGRPADLATAIELLRQAIGLSDAHGESQLTILFQLGRAFKMRYAAQPSTDAATSDADEAIRCFTDVLNRNPDVPLRIASLTQLGDTQCGRFIQGPRDVRSAEGAVRAFRLALETLLSAYQGALLAHPDHAGVPDTLGFVMTAADLLLHSQGNVGELADILPVVAQVVATVTVKADIRSPAVAACARTQALLLQMISERTDLDVTDELVTAFKRLNAITPPQDPQFRAIRCLLGRFALKRYERTRDAADLDTAVDALRDGTRGTENEPAGAGDFRRLGYALGERVKLAPDPSDLDEAIAAIRVAYRHAGSQADKDWCVEGLCTLLVLRYRVGGHLADLDETIALHTAGQQARPNQPHRAPGASAAAAALQYRAQARDDRSDHQLAHLMRLAGTDTRRERQSRPRAMLRSFFGLPYPQLVHQSEASALPHLLEEIAEQTAWLRTAVNGASGPDRVDLLDELVEALSARSLAAPAADVRDELIMQLRALTECIPERDELHRTAHEAGLGFALHERFKLSGAATDLDEALRWLAQAASADSTPTQFRIVTTMSRGSFAAGAGRWDLAHDAYRQAITLLPRLAARHLDQQDHVRQLVMFRGLASDAAAAAIRCADPSSAVELLEQGRGLLISYALDYRDDLAQVAQVAPALAEDLRRIGDGLAAEADPHAPAEPSPGLGSATDHRRDLARQWDDTVERIRRLPGFADFLRPARMADLVSAARSGPVIVVNVSQLGCDALVMTADGAEVVPLPDLSAKTVNERAAAFHAVAPFAELVPEDPVATHDAQEQLRYTLGWLWDTVAAPVFAHLDARGIIPERVWWVPTGALTLLPLHAAGRTGTSASVLDRTVSSYAPTIRILRSAQQAQDQAPTPAPEHTGRIVAVADAPGLPSLAGAVAEAGRLAEQFPAFDQSLGAAATRSPVLAALGDHDWVHIACHASTYAARPVDSALHLADGPLTVGDVLAIRHARGRVVYLSACQTVLAGPVVADEVIHLGSAFHIAGFPHVVGTLWQVTDGTAAETARLVYDELGPGLTEDQVPWAVHRAALRLRQQYPSLPSRWAAYLHLGP
jgi:tetratricopeptide (TPR) repeat protein